MSISPNAMHPNLRALPLVEARIKKLADRSLQLLTLARSSGTPLYVFDKEEATHNYQRFVSSFKVDSTASSKTKPFTLKPKTYFAVKSCPVPQMLKAIVEAGGGLDVSSERELNLALDAGCQDLVYTGPGKKLEELTKFLDVAPDGILHIDSFGELERLIGLLTARQQSLCCGVRVSTSFSGRWSKFGISLEDLPRFRQMALRCPLVKLSGLQFHQSMNDGAHSYIDSLNEILQFIACNFTSEAERAWIKWIDIGGGFPAQSFEGLYSWNPDEETLFDNSEEIRNILAGAYNPPYTGIVAEDMRAIGGDICSFWHEKVTPLLPGCQLMAEPGNYLADSVLHILMRVVDKKGPSSIIVDAGVNLVGYERYQYYSCVPLFNLTRWNPEREHRMLVYGSLCTPNDLWGYYVYGEEPEVGDVLLFAYQGDYTYTYSQPNFIRDIPQVVPL